MVNLYLDCTGIDFKSITKRDFNVYDHQGIQYIFKFDNGYGASVIKHYGSYGYDADLWEMAVLDSYGELCYNTPITNDVLGYLTEEEVRETLKKIKEM